MSVRQPRKPKPSALAEVGRVLVIYDALVEETDRRAASRWRDIKQAGAGEILIVAERIAARTED